MLRAEPRGTCFAHGPYENADGSIGCPKTVSYTHLDVYKRQALV